MKLRLIAAIVLLAASVGLSIFFVARLNSRTRELTSALESAMAATAAQPEEWASATQEALRLWERDDDFLHILLPHVNLNELEWALGSLEEYQRQGDKELYTEHCVRALQCLKTVREMERPNWGNVF